jgi:hypothetical protein
MMTDAEHRLIVEMLTRQAMAIRTLEELLRSKNLLTDDTLRGIQKSLEYSESERPDLIPQTLEIYKKTAKRLGVDFHD